MIIRKDSGADWGEAILDIGGSIAYAINILQNIIKTLLEETLFKQEPELAEQYSGAFSILILLTALYLLLVFASSLKRVIGYILLLGWGLLILSLILSKL